MKKPIVKAVFCAFVAVFSLVLLSNPVYAGNINACNASIDTPGTYTLTQNVSSPGTCFGVTTTSVLLDCQGFYVTYGSVAATQGQGFYDNGYDNITVQNCYFVQGAGAINKNAIYIFNANNVTISRTNATSTSGQAILISKGSNNVIDNSWVFSWQTHGIYLNNTNYNNITNTLISAGNGAGDYGVYMYNDSSYNTVFNTSILNSTGNSIRIEGITTGSTYNNISNDTMRATVELSTYLSFGNNNWILYNNINSTTVGGVYLYLYSSNNNVSYNNISVGNGGGDYGFYLDNNANNNFFGNNVVGSTGSAVALSATASSGNNFSSNSLNSSAEYGLYMLSGDSDYVWNNSIQAGAAAATYYGIYTDSVSNTVFHSNYIQARSATAGYGIYLYRSSNTNTIYNNTINVSAGQGIALTTTTSGNNMSLNFINATTAGFNFAATATTNTADSNNITVFNGYAFSFASSSSNNIIQNNIGGIQTNGATLSSSTGNTFTNNTLNSRAAVSINLAAGASNNVFNNNSLLAGNGGGGYVVTATSDSGNTFRYNNMTSYFGTAIYLQTSVSSFLFDSNNITSNASGSQAVSLTTTAYWNNFTNNNITSQTSYAVLLQTDASNNSFINNSIFSNTSIGVGVLSGSTYNVFDHNTIQSGSGNSAYGVYVDTSDYNNFTNNNISTRQKSGATGGHGVYMANGNAKFNWFENDTIFTNGTTAYGIYLVTNVYNNTFKNVTVTSNNSYGIDVSTTARNNTFNVCNVTSVQSFVVRFEAATSTNNSFQNCYLNNYYIPSGTTPAVVYFYQAGGNRFINVSINAGTFTNSRGIWSTGAAGIGSRNNRFYNSSITAAGTNGYDAYFDIVSSTYFLNVSYNSLDAFFNDALSSFNVSWYLNISVKDSTGTLVPYANVTAVDANGYTLYNGSTDANGYITPMAATQYLQTDEAVTNSSTPYNITAWKGSAWATISQAVTGNTNADVTLSSLSTCGSLTTNTTLANDVYAGGSCFTVKASYLTLNCSGYNVNFSRSSAGSAVNISGYNNVSIVNCTFFQGAVTNGSRGVYMFNSQNSSVINSTFSLYNATQVYLNSSNDTDVISTVLNTSNVTVTNSSLMNVKWYADVQVKDYSLNAVEGANVTFYNTSNNYTSSNTTNGSGSIPTTLLLEYTQRDSGLTYSTNYSINVSSGNVTNFTYLNLTSNKLATVLLNVTVCGTLNSNYTLTNNVLAAGTCFVANASNLILNCGGYAINYSRTTAGFAVNSTSVTGFTLNNCNITRGGTDASSYGVLFNMSNTGTIANSTFSTGNATAIFLSNSHNAAVVNTTITVNDGTRKIDMDSASSNASVYWFANVHVIGLANEDIPSAIINITDNNSISTSNATGDSTGRRTIMVREYSQDTTSAITYYTPLNYSATHPTTLQQNSSTDNTTSSKNITIQVVSAELNITTPPSSKVYLQGQTVNITINESKGTAWITNVTVYIYNDDLNRLYQATQTGDNWWEYDYAIDPAMTSRTIYITAYGMNGTTNVTATSQFIVTQGSGGAIADPVITSFCSNQTYALVNNSVSLNTTAQLGTVLYSITANVTYPNSTNNVLTQSGSTVGNESNYIYSALFNFTLPANGTYDIATTVRDVSNNIVSTTNRITAVNSSDSVSFNGTGVNYLTILDSCSPTVIANGSTSNGTAATISASVPAGLYRVRAFTSNPTITFANVSLNSTVSNTTFITYAEVSSPSYAAPSNRRYVEVFNITGNNVNYTNVDTFYNYTDKKSLLIAEASLEYQTCNVNSTCSWALIPFGLNTTTTNITGYENTTYNKLWAVVEPSSQTTNTIYITNTNTVTGSVNVDVPYDVIHEKIVEKLTSRHLFKAPQMVEIYSNGTATTQVDVINDGNVTYKKIDLSLSSPVSGMTGTLQPTSISMLHGGDSASVTLTVNTKNVAVGSYYIEITGVVGDYKDKISVPVKVVAYMAADKLEAERQLRFAKDLVRQNQECLEFTDVLKRAEIALQKGDIKTALKLESEAIEGCKHSLSLLRKDINPLTGLFGSGLLQGDWTTSAVIGSTGVIIGLTLVLLRRLTAPKRRNDELARQLEGTQDVRKPIPPAPPNAGAPGFEEPKKEGG